MDTENTLVVDSGLAASRTDVSHGAMVSFSPILYATQSWCMMLDSFSVVVAVLLEEPRQKFSPPSRFYVFCPRPNVLSGPMAAKRSLVDPAAPQASVLLKHTTKFFGDSHLSSL